MAEIRVVMSALGHERTSGASGMSALPLRADMLTICINVRFVPRADMLSIEIDLCFVSSAWPTPIICQL